MLIKIEKSRKYKENNYIMAKKLSKKSSKKSSKESSEESEKQEIYSQIEELKKKTEELNNKAKDLEEQTKDTEFNKQRNFIINKVRDFIGIEVSDEEVLAVIYNYKYLNENIQYYIKNEDENMLFERKVANRYARHHGIRCEDSFQIFNNYFSNHKIKTINDRNDFNKKYDIKARPKGYIYEKYVPLFC